MSSGSASSSEAGAPPLRILFVCSGNTCRSPLAEALARAGLRERGLDGSARVSSAGTGAVTGDRASPGSSRVAERHGLDLSEHRARSLTAELLRDVDLVLTMSPHHAAAALRMGGGDRVALLSAFAASGDDPLTGPAVSDPFGGDDTVYEATYHELKDLVEAALDRIAPGLTVEETIP